ncbi:MAG: hypothetical protein HRU09_18495 [Oligoflexales bacterium]|nr:hypothetical protein [Oligoflexales bacterium]
MLKFVVPLLTMIICQSCFSMISEEVWVIECQYSTGEQKKTFDAIRKSLGKIYKASCYQAFKRITESNSITLTEGDISDLTPLAGLTNLTSLSISSQNCPNYGLWLSSIGLPS